jgi:hypothetical protein
MFCYGYTNAFKYFSINCLDEMWYHYNEQIKENEIDEADEKYVPDFIQKKPRGN